MSETPSLKLEEMSEKNKSKMKVMGEKLGMTFDEIIAKKISITKLKKLLVQKQHQDEKPEKRRINKEKKKLKRKEMKAKGIKPSIVTGQVKLMKDSSNKTPIAIDLDFNDKMIEKDLLKLVKQIQRCYFLNRHSPEPCQLYLTSCTGALLERILKLHPGFENWDVHCHKQSYLDVLKDYRDKNTLIFLTSDSPNSLPASSELQSTNGQFAYVIGGLVDHNQYKGLTLGLAEQNGLKHARLPIDEHIKLACSHVLTVNQVFDLMLHAMHGTSWPEAFVKAIPQRKLNPDQSSRVKRRQRRAEAAAKELKTDVIEEHKSAGTSSDSSSSVSD